MSFRQIVDDAGGVSAFARRHQVPIPTIGGWYRSLRFPNATGQALLMEITGGQIDLNEMRRNHLARKGKEARRNTRLRSCVVVRDMRRLKQCFKELSLPPARLNLDAPHILRRWRITNVTVGEIRAAVKHLEQTGQDAGNIKQIHQMINTIRREAIRSLDNL